MLLKLFSVALILTQAFDLFESNDIPYFSEEVAFAAPPAFGSYNLHSDSAQLPPKPLISLEQTCLYRKDQGTLLDRPKFKYDHKGYTSDVMSCEEAFVMQKSIFAEDICNLAYHINSEEETLLDVCGQTFCNKCISVMNEPKEDDGKQYAVAESLEVGSVPAHGFEFSTMEREIDSIKQVEEVATAEVDAVSMMVPPAPIASKIEASYEQEVSELQTDSIEEVATFEVDAVSMMVPPAPIASKIEASYEQEVSGLQAPTPISADIVVEEKVDRIGLIPPTPVLPSLETIVDVQLDSTAVKSMVPPGLDAQVMIESSASRLKRYS